MKGGAWRAKMPGDDTWITYRPAGVASGNTKVTTATVEVNGSRINSINGDPKNVLKLKFPLTGETGPGAIR